MHSGSRGKTTINRGQRAGVGMSLLICSTAVLYSCKPLLPLGCDKSEQAMYPFTRKMFLAFPLKPIQVFLQGAPRHGGCSSGANKNCVIRRPILIPINRFKHSGAPTSVGTPLTGYAPALYEPAAAAAASVSPDLTWRADSVSSRKFINTNADPWALSTAVPLWQSLSRSLASNSRPPALHSCSRWPPTYRCISQPRIQGKTNSTPSTAAATPTTNNFPGML